MSLFKKISLISAALVLFTACMMAAEVMSFRKNSGYLAEKAGKLAGKAGAFNEKKVLNGLKPNGINGFYYRFDDTLSLSRHKKDYAKPVKTPDGISFEFDGADAVEFSSKNGKSFIENGILRFSYTEGDYLQNKEDLGVIKDKIGGIELRIKSGKCEKIAIGCNQDENFKSKAGIAVVDIIADGNFHVYEINTVNALKSRLKEGDVVKKVFLMPYRVEGGKDDIEIDYFRYVLKKEKYMEGLCGEAYETIGKEMRKAVYVYAPFRLKYRLDIPDRKTFLKFGMGILDEGVPVTFRVEVSDNDSTREIFSEKITSSDRWNDAKVDFSEWAGKDVEILFKAESEKGNIAFWANPVIYASPDKRFNVIIVLEDALRADHMSCYGYFRDTTPAADEFVKKGVVFLNAFSQSYNTRLSCSSFMTSLYPSATGVWNFANMLDGRYLTLAEALRNQGFATASFIQNGGAGPCHGLHQGFSCLFDDSSLGQKADQLYGKILYNWIESNSDRNFFLYIHLMDPHSPYDPLKPFDIWYDEGRLYGPSLERQDVFDPPWVKNVTLEGRRRLYDGQIRSNDAYFEKFLKKLREGGLLDDTLVIVTADHGEFLGERGLWGHRAPCHIQVLHVPLAMIYPKELPVDVKISQPVQLMDIMPTILDLAGIDRSGFIIEGESLLPLMRGENIKFWNDRILMSEEIDYEDKPRIPEGGSVFYKNLHIMNSSGGKENAPLSLKIFDYSRDREEKESGRVFLRGLFLGDTARFLIKETQAGNLKIWETLTGRAARDTVEYCPEDMEKLKSLGYLQ